MSPTATERLLALADDYEAKAKSLRLAAAELNGHLTTKAQGRHEQTLTAAITLRQQQRATAPPVSQADKRATRAGILRQHLAHGPARISELREALRTHGGGNLSHDTIIRLMKVMPDVHAVAGKRWALGKKASTRTTPPRTPTQTERQTLLRAALAHGPQSTRQLLAYLADHGFTTTAHTVRPTLESMRDVRHTGATLNAKWHLRGHRPVPPPPRPFADEQQHAQADDDGPDGLDVR